jgi:hypothetical protein
MGNDGGSIAKRIDLVKEKTKEVRKDTVAISQNRSRYCAISNNQLTPPIVGCRLGYLYNKEALLSCLINKTMPTTFDHICKLKDVKNINATENSNKQSPYPLICPLTAVEYNGLTRFVFLWSCGCLMSERSLGKTNEAGKTYCPLCSSEYQDKDVVLLNLTPEEIEAKKQLLMAAKPPTKTVEDKKDANLGVNHP